MMKTTNGGATWIGVYWGPEDVSAVRFIDANLGYTCSESGIHKTTNGGDSFKWFLDESSPFSVGPTGAIDFAVENSTAVVFALGYHEIYRTSFEYLGGEPVGNSGSYPGWVPVSSGTTGYIHSVEYINPFVAFGVGGDPGGAEQGLILRTINGGQSWTRQQSNVPGFTFADVSCADVTNGIAVGGGGTILRTTDGGAHWMPQTSGTSFSIEAVAMLDLNNAFACGVFGLMLHTSDGGASWQKQTSGTAGVSWNAVECINPTTATAVGFAGKIVRTTNGGLSWFEQTGGGNLNLSGVRFTNVNNGIAISAEGPVLRTTDGGTTWVQGDSLDGYASAVSYADSQNVFVVTQIGGVSRIYHSTNGGAHWMLQSTDNASYQSISFADATNGIITGSEGLILRTSNAGVVSGTNDSYNRNGLNAAIGDFQNTTDSISVSGIYKAGPYAVSRIYVRIDTLLHAHDADLELYLEHGGVTDTLVYRNGGSGADFLGTFLNDESSFPLVSGTAPFRGSFKPYRPLSKFNGQDPNGAWKLRIYDGASGNTGTLEAWSLTIIYRTLSGIAGNPEIPSAYELSQNYPNPFNPMTTIRYVLPERSVVSLRVFNMLGQEVATLVDGIEESGERLLRFNGSHLASGVYYYRLLANAVGEHASHMTTKKMVMVK